MPHCVILYTPNVEAKTDMTALCRALADTIGGHVHMIFSGVPSLLPHIESGRLRAIANAADSRVSIERTAQLKLAQQIRTLEQENAQVREELATFESMLSSEARNAHTLSIYRFKVEADGGLASPSAKNFTRELLAEFGIDVLAAGATR